MKYLYCKLSDFAKSEYEAEYSLLSRERRERIDRIRNLLDKQRSLAGVMLQKKLLKEEFGIPNPIIEHTEKGAPYLKNGPFCISIAHSDEMVVAVAADTPIGIDLEKIRDIDLALCKKTCTEREEEYVLGGLSDWEKSMRFLEVWTAKEAYFKKQGTGITNLKSVCIFDLERKLLIQDGYLIQIVK